MKPLVSVIVPVYNVEDCLRRCLDSLCKQSLKEIEIILVDDASPDRCGCICEEYTAKDVRFKVYHHEINRGLSAARNTGITHASAEFLMFVDSDDCVHQDFCKLPYECAVRYQADLVMFKRLRLKHSQSVLSLFPFYLKLKRNKDGYKTRKEAMNLLHNGSVGEVAWNKFYKKDLFREISYPVGYLHEDVGTTYKIIWRANRVFYLDKMLYYKYARENSITHHRTKESYRDSNEMYKQQYHDIIEWSKVTNDLDSYLLYMALTYCIVKKQNDSDWYYVYSSNLLRSCNKIPADFVWKRKVLLFLFKYCPSFFEFICTICGKKDKEPLIK